MKLNLERALDGRVGQEVALWTEKHAFQGKLVEYRIKEVVVVREALFFGIPGGLAPGEISVEWGSIIAVAVRP